MNLRTKLIIIIVFLALVPMTLSAWTSLGVHQRAFDGKIRELHRVSARYGAALVQEHLDNAVRNLSLATRAIRWPELSVQELTGALWMVYRQHDDIAVASLLDENGEGIGGSVFVDEASRVEELSGHPLASLPILEAFAGSIPFEAAKKDGTAIGQAFVGPGSTVPIVPLAMRVRGRAPGADWIVTVGLSTGSICERISQMRTGETRVLLVDGRDRIVCQPAGGRPLQPVGPELSELASVGELRFHDGAGQEYLATAATLSLGWSVVVQQPTAEAFAASARMRQQTIFWIVASVLVAIFVGLFLGRSISVPIKQLVEGAEQFAQGHFGHRLPVEGSDELGRLSATFNHMGVEIEKRDSEIRAWNRELQQRVEDRTRELKEVQEQLVQSQKIAAVTSLGAGIAHEINNPLTAVLGLTQIMISQTGKDEALKKRESLLKTVEKEGLRIKGIVRTLLSFSQDYAGESFMPMDLNELLDSTISMVEKSCAQEGIEIVRDYCQEVPSVLGNRTKMQQVFLHLMNNSRIAMPQGGRLAVSTRSVEGKVVRVSVADTGKGIAPENLDKIFEPFFTTKDNWEGEGLGLTVVFRIVEEHHGKIKAESEVGRGTTMTVTLPAAKRRAHLA
ncbi:MAG: HAMP domain-containing protein [Deltaproteobacteria bacterium]|nr:HAMP domain-containing protein [Deltaproteobacteria bacterium]